MKSCLHVFSLVALFFFFLGWNAPVFAAPVSKLGIFVIGPNNLDKVSTIVEACPAVLKVQDAHSYESVRAMIEPYKKNCGGTVIFRVYVAPEQEKYTVSFIADSPNSPVNAARSFWGRLSGPVQKLKDQGVFQHVDYVSGPNEYDNMPVMQGGDREAARWTADFWVELATLMHAAGAKPILGEFPVGNLEPEHYPFLAEALKKIKALGIDVAFSYHSYGKSYTFNAADEQWYSLRYRKFRAYLESDYPDLLDVPFYITEVGVGLSETGFETADNQEALKVWLAAFDEEIKKDAYVKGGTLFQIGGWTDWAHRAIEGIAGWFSGYINGNGEVPVVVSPDSGHDECEDQGFLANLSGLFRTWWELLTKSAVPDDIALVTDSKLPPRDRTKCVVQRKTDQTVAGSAPIDQNVLQAQDSFTSRTAEAAHDYTILASLVHPTTVPLPHQSWIIGVFGGDAGDIFGAGLPAAGKFLEARLPPAALQDKPDLPEDPSPEGDISLPPDSGIVPSIGGWSAWTLVDRIRQHCINGIVQRGSYGCVDNLATAYTPGASQTGIDIMKNSAASYKYLQCVGFATASVKITTDIDVPGRGSAVNYSWDVPSEWVFTPFNQSNQEKLKNGTIKLAAGDLVVWGYYTHGHIANVCGIVDAAAYKYTVCEANWGSGGLVHKRDIELFHEINLPLYNEKIENGLLGFLRKS